MSPTRMSMFENNVVEADLRAEIERLTGRNAQLERLSQNLEQFVFAASHDLTEPLRAISIYAQLLVRKCNGSLDSEAAQFVANIVDGAARMNESLSDLLTYARIGAQPDTMPEPVELNGILESVKENLKGRIDETKAVIRSDDLPVVTATSSDFISLFQNLLANAIKYRATDTPQICVSAQRIDGELRLAVKDNGIGIDPAFHEQIFEAFRRVSSRKVPGTGLGLAICRRIADRYSGRIWVESQPGQGATFVIAFPEAELLGGPVLQPAHR